LEGSEASSGSAQAINAPAATLASALPPGVTSVCPSSVIAKSADSKFAVMMVGL